MPRSGSVLAVLAVMAVMVTYVETMVLPAFSQFVSFFGNAPVSTVIWILAAYLLVGTVATPIFGKLGDHYGKKRLLLIAMGTYAAAVTAAGFTPEIGSSVGLSLAGQLNLLIAVRAVQGVGLAMFPLGFAMIPEVFPASRVGRAQGVISAMFSVGAALGLVGGGWIAQNYGWQLTYHTVVPVAIGLVVVAAWIVPESPTRKVEPLDFLGISLLGISLGSVMVALTEAPYWGWGNPGAVRWGVLPWGTPEFLVLAAVAAGAFVVWERMTESPVVRFASLRPRNIWISNVTGILAGVMMYLGFTVVTIIAEEPVAPGFNLTEVGMGLLALPAALSMLALGPLAGSLSTTRGPKPVMVVGFTLQVAAFLGLYVAHGTPLEVLLFMIPAMTGIVWSLIAMTNIIVLSVERTELGIQTGMNQTFRNLGSALGPVLATSILSAYLLTVPLGPGRTFETFANEGYRVVFATAAALGAIGVLLSLGLRNFRYRQDGTRSDSTSPMGRTEARSERRSPVVDPADPILTPLDQTNARFIHGRALERIEAPGPVRPVEPTGPSG